MEIPIMTHFVKEVTANYTMKLEKGFAIIKVLLVKIKQKAQYSKAIY
jgi:hypothetical protein